MNAITRGISRLGYLCALLTAGAVLNACSGGQGDPSTDAVETVPVVEQTPAETPTDSAPPAAETDTLLQINWQASPDNIAGYLVYYGSDANAATMIADIPITNAGFNPSSPSASYYAARDLNLAVGSTVCFRIRAYFTPSLVSDWSQPACGTV